MHRLHLKLTDSPGALTSVIQAFSGLNLPLDEMNYARTVGEATSALTIRFHTNASIADLARRKLDRLIAVVSIESDCRKTG